MVNKTTKDRIAVLKARYEELVKVHPKAIHEIAISEIPEMVYNSNAIENSTLTLEETEDILLRDMIRRDHDIREVYEAKNLAEATEHLLNNTHEPLTTDLILRIHKILLTNINDDWAGNFRHGKQWVRVGTHIGANPEFVQGLMSELVAKYNTNRELYFLDNMAWFHAEFETIHPFPDGNGRIGRVLINQQLMRLGYPPIIIPNKGKRFAYYPAFDSYCTNDKYDDFTDLFARLLAEELYRRIAILSSKKIVTLSVWAKDNNINVNVANNKARRGTLPAFRIRGKWMIAANVISENCKGIVE